MTHLFHRSIAWPSLLLLWLGMLSPAAAQFGGDARELFPDFSLGQFGGPVGAGGEDPYEMAAEYSATGDGIEVRVRFELQPGWHVYSLTQPAGGPTPTKLQFPAGSPVELLGQWTADQTPKKAVSAEFGGLTIEEHDDTVTFTAVARPKPPGDVSQLGPVEIKVRALACMTGGACIPINETLTAKRRSAPGTPAAADAPSATDAQQATDAQSAAPVDLPEFRDGNYVVAWQAALSSASAAPGQTISLTFTAKPDATFHVYTAAVNDEPSKTNFALAEKSGLRIGTPTTDSRSVDLKLMPGITYHDGNVTWTLPVQVPVDAAPGAKSIRGAIAYQACQELSCQKPAALEFAVVLNVVDQPAGDAVVPVTLTATKRAAALDMAAETWVDAIKPDASPEPKTPPPAATMDADGSESGGMDAAGAADGLAASGLAASGLAASGSSGSGSSAGGDVDAFLPDNSDLGEPFDDEDEDEPTWLATVLASFPGQILFGFLGGIILNFMPCVLPVVGLKVMSFVQQAGENRGRIFMLNFVYALGILAVFAILSGLIVGFKFSWGQQFTFEGFRLGLTVVLFALALSYLGVWEIPAPGFAAGKTSQSLGAQEGYTGAFFKGMFATLLATPCSGPLLGYIFGATINLSPVQSVAILMAVGLGMAVPYLIIGLQPRLVSWLPKPGPWMETLKEFLAFMFLGTVAFFFYGFSDEKKMPVFVTLIGVWFGCWIIGKVPSWQALERRLTAWAGGVAAAAAIGLWAFWAFQPQSTDVTLPWQPYSEARLAQLQSEGKTVMLDFTADWCVNCKINEHYALNTPQTKQLLDELDAVALVADWSNENPEIEEKLNELDSRSIPVLAIYPGSNPGKPIILRDLVRQSSVLKALRRAGPSVGGVAGRQGERSVVFANVRK